MDGRKDKLEGWGEIESYLRLTRKTVRRRGYPVHSLGGEVFAYVSWLDAHRANLEAIACAMHRRQPDSFSMAQQPGTA